MRLFERLLCLGLTLVAFGLSAAAATLTGHVHDASTNSFLLGANVTVREASRENSTDRDGVFTVSDLPPGIHTVSVSYLGYADAKVSYRLTKRLRVCADVINLGQEPLNEYSGYAHRMSATESYWWTANFGLSWKL